MELTGRKVEFFRCHFDPSIGPRPQKAIHAEKMMCEIEMKSEGVYVKEPNGLETVVPYPNCEMIRLKPLDKANKPSK